MSEEKTNSEAKSVISTIIYSWVPPAVTTILGLIGGISLATYNAELTTNRFFLEKQVITADKLASEFSTYIDNSFRMFNELKRIRSEDERRSEKYQTYMNDLNSQRINARDKLRSSLDSVHLYYDKKTSNIVEEFRTWEEQHFDKNINTFPDIKEWRKWQTAILQQLRDEIMITK